MTQAPPPLSNPHKGRTGLDRIWRALGYSARGLGDAWRGESAFRQEVLLSALMLPAVPFVARGWLEAAVLVAAVVLVLVVELLNSAIEAVVDRVSLDLHELSRRAKDFGSAAVLLALLLCGGIWAAALWQRLSEG